MANNKFDLNEAIRRREALDAQIQDKLREGIEVQNARRLLERHDRETKAFEANEAARAEAFNKRQADDLSAFDTKQQDQRRAAEQRGQADATFFERQRVNRVFFERVQRDREQREERQAQQRQENFQARSNPFDLAEARFIVAVADQEEKRRAENPSAPPSPNFLEPGRYSVGMGDGSNHNQAWADAANAARERDRNHALAQEDLRQKADQQREDGDLTGAKLTTLEASMQQKAYEADVWNDVANKEFLIRGETNEYREALEASQAARQGSEDIAYRMTREEELAAVQVDGLQVPEVEVDPKHGLGGQKDPFDRETARQREADARLDLPPEQRQDAAARDKAREEAAHKRETLLRNAAQAQTTAAHQEPDPAKRAENEAAVERLGVNADRVKAEEAAKGWKTIADVESKKWGETATYRDAMERYAIADKAEGELRGRFNVLLGRQEPKESESESEGAQVYRPGFANAASTDAARGASKPGPYTSPDVQRAADLNASVPENVRPKNTEANREPPSNQSLSDMNSKDDAERPAESKAERESKNTGKNVDMRKDVGNPSLSKMNGDEKAQGQPEQSHERSPTRRPDTPPPSNPGLSEIKREPPPPPPTPEPPTPGRRI